MSAAPDTVALLGTVLAVGNRLATLEIVAMGRKMGLPLDAMVGVINKGSGRNRTSEVFLPRMASGPSADAPSLSACAADLGRAVRTAMACGAPATITNTVRAMVQAAANTLGKDATLESATACIESMAGVRLLDTEAGPGSNPAPATQASQAQDPQLRVGYVGLGAMGGALARRLMLSRKLRVFDLRGDAMKALQAEGALVAEDLASLARDCDVIFTCLPNSSIVRDIVFGEAGLARGLAPGKVIVDQTTGDPMVTRAIAAELEKQGVAFVDAPVSGGPRGAVAGTIAVMCGGPAAAYERVRGILESISPNLVHCGAIGNGHVAKLINNAVASCNRALVYEVAAIAVRQGIRLADLAEPINRGPGASSASERILPAVSQGKGSSDFQLQLMVKDLRLAGSMAVETGAPMTIAGVVRSIFEAGAHRLGGTANLDEMARGFEAMAGVRFAGA